jgi:hypothetical protein
MTRKAVVIPIRQDASFREPTLDEVMADSVTRAVMRADGVDPTELRALLSQVGRLRNKGNASVAGEGADFHVPKTAPTHATACCWGISV